MAQARILIWHRSFPPSSLYKRTRFSLVFESSISVEATYESFLTEKVLKPLYGAHPFLLLCAAVRVWDILRSFGFRSFDPLIPSVFADPNSRYRGPCNGIKKGGIYATQVIKLVSRIQAATDDEWRPALAAAAHNQRQLLCPDRFLASMRRLSFNQFKFAALLRDDVIRKLSSTQQMHSHSDTDSSKGGVGGMGIARRVSHARAARTPAAARPRARDSFVWLWGKSKTK
mmetsp:Transcript_42414/g.95854  ORF Transcript_42414/g.95854 Transcript_42414/m.95854 type:complete len:229 (-) Transcript_42414:147-833(-)